MARNLYVVTEKESQMVGEPTFCVVGVFSSREMAQQALVNAIRSVMACHPEAEFAQQPSESGLLISAPGVGTYTYDIVMRAEDEMAKL